MRKYYGRWGWFTADDVTGLPELPSGSFWRVTEPETGGIYYHLEIHDNLGLVNWTIVDVDLEDAAGYMMHQGMNFRPPSPPDLSSLVGDYPPNTVL